MKSSRVVLVSAVLAIAVLVSSCDQVGLVGGTGQDLAQGLPVFSVDLFEQNIRNAFLNESVGFTYAIAVQGTLERSDAVGSARLAPDSPRSMAVADKMHVASVSKTIATAAILRLIQDTPTITLQSSIAPYLPSGWTVDPSVLFVSFEDLLLHQAGFSYPDGQSRFTNRDLQTMISTGVVDPNQPPNQTYSNAHHNLLRVIVPEILGVSPLVGEDDVTFRARVFGTYVQDVVFDPAGVTAPVMPPADPVHYYAFPHDGNAGLGLDTGWQFSEDFGAYGWYLSAVDIVRILSYLNYTEAIVSEEMRDAMNQQEYGYWNSRTGDKGRYQMKQGGWSYTVDSVSKGVQSIAAHFPGGIDAAVIVNSRRDPGFNMASVMRDAFDASFVDP